MKTVKDERAIVWRGIEIPCVRRFEHSQTNIEVMYQTKIRGVVIEVSNLSNGTWQATITIGKGPDSCCVCPDERATPRQALASAAREVDSDHHHWTKQIAKLERAQAVIQKRPQPFKLPRLPKILKLSLTAKKPTKKPTKKTKKKSRKAKR